MADTPYIHGETYPCEPYQDSGVRNAWFDYRIGYRAWLGLRDLGLYPARMAAEKAIAAGMPTSDAIEPHSLPNPARRAHRRSDDVPS